MRIAFQSWHTGKRLGKNLSAITDDFEVQTKLYYCDACELIKQFKAPEFARLLLTCSVYHKPVKDYLLPGEFNVKHLMDMAIIFSNAVECKLEGSKPVVGADICYVIPSALFLCLNEARLEIGLR